MNAFVTRQHSGPVFRALSTNSTATEFASVAPQSSKPTGSGVFDLAADLAGAAVPEKLGVIPFALGADGDQLNVRVFGWRQIATLWVPVLLAELAATVGTTVGVAGQPVIATERFADTLALTDGNTAEVTLTSPENNLIAHALVSVKGFPVVQVDFDTGAAPPTSMNALLFTV